MAELHVAEISFAATEEDDDEHRMPPQLPMDMMYKITEHVTDPATLARLASSSRFWRHLIKDSTFLDNLRRRHRHHGFAPSLLLGFFYQEMDMDGSALQPWQHHMDQRRCGEPRFMPISELSQFAGNSKAGDRDAIRPPPSIGIQTFIQYLGARLNFHTPTASHDSFMAFHRRRSTVTMDNVCVCNPLADEIFDVCSSFDIPLPDHYALFATDAQFFELVAVWIRKTTFVCQSYSSVTRQWQWGETVLELIPGLYLVSSTPVAAATSHGAIRWLCSSSRETMTATHVATLHAQHVDEMELSYLELPPEAQSGTTPPLLVSSAGGELLLLLLKNGLQISLWRHDGCCCCSCCWVLCQSFDMRSSSLPPRVVSMGNRENVKLEMFGGKSGMVVLWIDGEGQFLFSLADGSLRKISSEHMTEKYDLCPYEIDWLSCLAITNLVVDGSLALDEGRRKARDRWRTLMSKNLATN